LAGVGHRRARLREWLIEYKQTLSCQRCGFRDFRALQFHHDGRAHKQYHVSDLVRGAASLKTLKNEISKCVVLCANCHQIEHYEERVQRWQHACKGRAGSGLLIDV
jgi:hypothetical protein